MKNFSRKRRVHQKLVTKYPKKHENKTGTFTNMLRINSMLLNKKLFKEEIKRETK